MIDMNSHLDRRKYLSAIVTSTTIATAGCNGVGGSTDQPESEDEQAEANPGESAATQSDMLSSVDIQKKSIEVTITDSESLSALRLIGPDGSQVASVSVNAGVTKYSLDISSYKTGENKLVAIADGEIVDESTLTFKPEIEIADIGTTAEDDTPDFEWMSEHQKEDIMVADQVWVTVKNTGNVPGIVENIMFNTEGVMGLTDPVEDLGPNTYWQDEHDDSPKAILPGESFTFLSKPRSGILFDPKKVCDGTTGTMKIEVILSSGKTTSKKFEYLRSEKEIDTPYLECPMIFDHD